MSVLVKILITVVLILAAPAAFFGYRAYTHSTAYLLAQGDRAAEEGKHDEVERLARLLEKKGESQAAHLLRGEFYVYAGEVALKKVLPPMPSEEIQRISQMVLGAAGLSDLPIAAREIVWLTASFYQKQVRASSPALNAYRIGLDELARIRDDGPIGVKGTVLAAECLLRLDEKRLAAEGLKALVKRHPDNKDAHRFLSAIYIDLNSSTEAIQHLQEWARLDPTDGLPCRWIGFYKKENNLEREAAEAYEEALKRELTPSVRAEVLKELADIYINLIGENEKASAILDQGSDTFQHDPAVIALRVRCLRNVEREGEAVELVEKALQQNPNLPEILFLRAQIHISEDQHRQALPLLEKAVRLDPYDLPVLTALVGVYRQLEQREKAAEVGKQAEDVQKIGMRLSELEQEANSHPWDDRVREEIAVLALRINRLEQARTWVIAALACNPNNFQARRLLAQLPANHKETPSADQSSTARP
jgi:tetratricopeptide (TPR) repeat protein